MYLNQNLNAWLPNKKLTYLLTHKFHLSAQSKDQIEITALRMMLAEFLEAHKERIKLEPNSFTLDTEEEQDMSQ